MWIVGTYVNASYVLPTGMIPYSIHFYDASDGQDFHYSNLYPKNGNGSVGRTEWRSQKGQTDDLHLSSGTGYTVRLFYGPRTCHQGPPCKPVLRSNPFIVKTSNNLPTLIGPGALVGASSGSGDFASTSVSGSALHPGSFTVRVSSDPSAQNVDVNWDIVCIKGGSVHQASGSFQDITPVNDSTSIGPSFLDFLNPPDSCDITVSASLGLSDTGDISTGILGLHVYAGS